MGYSRILADRHGDGNALTSNELRGVEFFRTSRVSSACGADGAIRTDEVGDWRDVLAELPGRIHEWMPRLAEEGVVGADAIFACLGPALEIFSRYNRVEKASGEAVPLREYLEKVWAAVSTEALSMIFEDADAAGLGTRRAADGHVAMDALDGGNGNRRGEKRMVTTKLRTTEDENRRASGNQGRVTSWSTTRPGRSPRVSAHTWKN